jgi:hypothetical protein
MVYNVKRTTTASYRSTQHEIYYESGPHSQTSSPENHFLGGGVQHWKFSKLTRGKLLKSNEWDEWRRAGWLQLNQYYNQGMFGGPTFVKDHSQVFHLVWTYMIKDLNARKKAGMA